LCLSCNVKKFKTRAKLSENSWKKRHYNIFQGCPLCSPHLYCYHFLLSLYMNQVPERKALLGTWWNNTEVYLNPFISTQNHIIARSSTNKTDRHDINEILLNVALNTMNQPTNHNCRINWNIVERSIKHK
jgi:hypothetical protein